MQGTILTDVGLAKILAASPENPVVITEIAAGDGSGGYPPLTSSMTALVNEVWRGDATFPLREGAGLDTLRFEGIIPRAEGGFTVREIAIFDDVGDMIAIGQTNEIVKPVPDSTVGLTLTLRLRVKLDNASDVDLFITESIIYDHRMTTFRDEPNAHPADAIDLDQGVTVQGYINNLNGAITTTPFAVQYDGSYHILDDSDIISLPTAVGFAGRRVRFTKVFGLEPQIQVDGVELINTATQGSDTSVILVAETEYIFASNGTNWEV